MSAVQLKWLTNNFAQGRISREVFESVFHSLKDSEDAALQENTLLSTGKPVRLHPVTRRVLCQLRIYRRIVNVVNYIIIFSGLGIVYLGASYYQHMGSLPEFSMAGFNSLVSQLYQKPLPNDIKQAAEFLSGESDWSENHVTQFLTMWESLDPQLQQQYQKDLWYRSFLLALSLQITEQRTLAKRGHENALQKSVTLVKLSSILENKPT